MTSHYGYDTPTNSQLLADLEHRAAELERELSDARRWLAGEHAPTPPSRDERTEALVTHGRPSSYAGGVSKAGKAAAGMLIVAAIVTVLIIMLAGGGASWPASVAVVQSEAARACQNPDVRSEPGQVDFACAKATRQILWVFALLTSHDNADYVDTRTGRMGLEPITPSQGGEVALSLNLHHPYDPTNPVDSLQVAARAINDIVGGATVTGTNGVAVVQPGLEGSAAGCVRYTGSPSLATHRGFPSLCARAVASVAGQEALVADVFQKWVVGADPAEARDAAVLFANSTDPGNPAVQAILKHLDQSHGPH